MNHDYGFIFQPMAGIPLFILFKIGPNPASFCLFSSFSQHNDKYNTKFHYLKAWDLNPGPQNGMHRQNHCAMAAPRHYSYFFNNLCAREREREKML